MKNKKLITGLMILATIILIVSAGCIGSKPTYVIGMDAALSPWEVMGSDGNPQGINIDLINLIAKDQGFEIEYYVPEVGQWENDLVNKVIDTEGATVITPEREVKYAFAKMPFEPTRYLAIARADTGITLDDVLSGKASLAIFGTSVYEEWAKKQFGDEYSKMVEDGRIIIKDTADELAFAVLSRQVDSAIAGSMTFSRQLNLYQPLKFIGYVGEPKEIGFVVRKDDTELLNKLNTGIENVRNTDEFKAILDRYNLQYKKDVYVVGISDKNKPWSYLGSDGKYAGYDIEQIEWIADNYDFDVEYKVSTAERSLNDIIVGDIDMWASSMAVTPERLQYVAFSDPYYKSGSEEYGIATSNGNVVLQNLLNEGLAEFEKSGKKAEVLKKYWL